MPDYPIIDAHVHTYRSPEIGRQAMMGFGHTNYGGTVEELLPLMERAGIQRAVMVNMTPVADMIAAALARLPPHLSPANRQAAEVDIRREMIDRTQRRNAWTCQVAQGHPHLVAFIGLDPSMGEDELLAELDARVAQGARGLKLHPAANRFYPGDRRLWPAYQRAQSLGLPITFHCGAFMMDPGNDFAHPGRFAEVLAAFPGLTVILAHSGWGAHDAAIELARAYPNAAFDCCGVINGSQSPPSLSDEDAVNLIRALGVDRVMFGSDYPWFDPVLDSQRIQRLPLTEAERRAVLYENARRILGL